jgi:hypothetical protein
MKTTANNQAGQQIVSPVEVFRFTETKVNKHSTIYAMVDIPTVSTFVTELVRIEQDQGFGKAPDFDQWLRIRDQSNWKNCNKTGLRKTRFIGRYFGDFCFNIYEKPKTRTLVIVAFNSTGEQFQLYVYPKGYYPSPARIEAILQAL